MDPLEEFKKQVQNNICALGEDSELRSLTIEWGKMVNKNNYSYNFTWMGRPIIQCPQDIVALQEIIWQVQPDLILETGIAHGGSLIFSASMLELVGGNGQVLGLDIDIRKHNFGEIVCHPMYKRITMLEGSSIDERIVEKVFEFAKSKERVLVCLDSDHTHKHVLTELEVYAPLVSVGSYCVVFDTGIEGRPEECSNRSWGNGNNPRTAVDEFLRRNDQFEIDKTIENKLVITSAPGGYLKRVK